MSTTRPARRGYTVTVEVFVPEETARREVDRLDRAWHNEGWTPEAAAYEVVREALAGSGLDRVVGVRTAEVPG